MGWYELKERKSSSHGMKEKLMEIKALLCELCEELEMEESLNKSSSEDIFTKINKAFAEDDDDFYDNFDEELEKINKYSHEFENNFDLENIEVSNPQNVKIQIIINKNDLDKK